MLLNETIDDLHTKILDKISEIDALESKLWRIPYALDERTRDKIGWARNIISALSDTQIQSGGRCVIWVDPEKGSDDNDGSSKETALKTLGQAAFVSRADPTMYDVIDIRIHAEQLATLPLNTSIEARKEIRITCVSFLCFIEQGALEGAQLIAPKCHLQNLKWSTYKLPDGSTTSVQSGRRRGLCRKTEHLTLHNVFIKICDNPLFAFDPRFSNPDYPGENTCHGISISGYASGVGTDSEEEPNGSMRHFFPALDTMQVLDMYGKGFAINPRNGQTLAELCNVKAEHLFSSL